MTAVAAIAGVAAGMSAGPAAAATGNPPSASSSAGIVLTAHLAGTAQTGTAQQAGSPGAAVTALPFDQVAASARRSPLGLAAHAGTSAPLGQSAPAGPLATQVPDQHSAQAPQHPGSVNAATAQTSSGGSASQPTAPAGSTASPPPPLPGCAAPPAPRPQPFRLYDSVTPQWIPPGAAVATYATGGYAVPASVVAGRSLVLWIDTRGTDPAAQALDVEPGDATPAVAAAWASARLTHWPNKVARIYTMISVWPAVKAAIASLPPQMQSHVHYWIADPTGVPHIVPGSMATQWYWGPHWEISRALPGF